MQNYSKYYYKKYFTILLFSVFLFTSAQATVKIEKDSLAKYSTENLFKICYTSTNPKIYCDEISNRKMTIREQSRFYKIYAEKYYFEELNDYAKAIGYLKKIYLLCKINF